MGAIKDKAGLIGRLTIELRGPDGALKRKVEVENLVVNTGLDWIAERMRATPAVMSHMAVGTSATAAAGAQAALISENGRVTLDSTSDGVNTTTYQATFPAGTGTGALTEAGILNAASTGTMLNRATFAVINKGANDSLVITWDVTLS